MKSKGSKLNHIIGKSKEGFSHGKEVNDWIIDMVGNKDE